MDFNKLTDDFMYGALALTPVSATQAGYHEHNGMSLDEALDDYSAAARPLNQGNDQAFRMENL